MDERAFRRSKRQALAAGNEATTAARETGSINTTHSRPLASLGQWILEALL